MLASNIALRPAVPLFIGHILFLQKVGKTFVHPSVAHA
jgi:hypothetical protein